MDSLSGKQVKDLKELYSSIYKVEQLAEESISEVNFEEYFESLSEEKKKNFFQRVFNKFMQGPDYGNKRKKDEEDKIDKKVDDYVNKNKSGHCYFLCSIVKSQKMEDSHNSDLFCQKDFPVMVSIAVHHLHLTFLVQYLLQNHDFYLQEMANQRLTNDLYIFHTVRKDAK